MLCDPPDACWLIVHYDDFGMCHSENVGTIRSIQNGLAG